MKRNSKRNLIVETAVKLVRKQGYYNTSVDDIIGASGVWRGSFYYHFKTKEELGFAVLEAQFSDVSQLFETAIQQAEKPEDAIENVFRAVVIWFRENNINQGCPFGNLACEMSALHEGFRDRLARLFHDFQSQFAKALSPARFRMKSNQTPESLAEFVMGALEGAILLGKVNNDIDVLERILGHALAYIKHNLRSSEPQKHSYAAVTN